MPILDEPRAIDEVVERMAARFPQVPAERVRGRVDAALAAFDGSSVRDFVPVLIEHRVVNELRGELKA